MGTTTPSAEDPVEGPAVACAGDASSVPVSGGRGSAWRVRAPSQGAGVRMRRPRSCARASRRLRCRGLRRATAEAPMRRASTPSSRVEAMVGAEESSRTDAGTVRTRLRSSPTSVAAHQPRSSPPMTAHQPALPWRRARAARRRAVDPRRLSTPESCKSASAMRDATDATAPGDLAGASFGAEGAQDMARRTSRAAVSRSPVRSSAAFRARRARARRSWAPGGAHAVTAPMTPPPFHRTCVRWARSRIALRCDINQDRQ